MKTTLKTLALFLLLTLFQGCCKEKTEHLEFSPTHLNQTRWMGTFESVNAPTIGHKSRAQVGIIFVSEKRAGYSALWDNGFGEAQEDDFEYTISGKIMHIQKGEIFSGIWFLTYFDGKSMTLEQGNGGEGSYKAVLTLKKKD